MATRGALGALAALGVVLGVVLVLGPLSWLVAGRTVRGLDGKERADAINAVRQIVLAALGGTSALVALGFTVRTYYLSRRGQITDRFNKAIAQLASDKIDERIGGIFALEHVMAESAVDHGAVVAVLCSYVRRNTLRPELDDGAYGHRSDDSGRVEPAADIDAAVTVLARRPARDEPNRPDLRAATLAGASVRIMDAAESPNLRRMFLTWADLRRAQIRGADLRGTIANGADLRDAWLDGSDLRDASFVGADLRGAVLRGVRLAGTMLDGSDLRDVRGLTAEQLAGAFIDETTRLPEDLAQDPWARARLADCLAWRDARPGPWSCPPRTPAPASGG
ncbi:pentapeptide repeat-containing protein [Actinomadura atramentaria]|uniref:pentapeptide repeat-containing protein n=1 Tax=Actinomadura atramentaria TaxID=1990 RepID=UPI0003A88296|nr:pentapeptide repeat-containing protein [Actinomadura atramentaria]